MKYDYLGNEQMEYYGPIKIKKHILNTGNS